MVAGDEVQDRLKQLCEEHNLRYGIFWMDQNGVASYGTSYELPERMREMQQAGLPVYTIVSRNFSFARGEGSIGRVLENRRYEWVPNVQVLSVENFSRLDAAKASSIKTCIIIGVNGGVVEMGSFLKIKENPVLVKTIKSIFARMS
mmetsp:Transcript_1938/g.6930  ORF Transcript_1938/g.6930 Transcript_1938/m.6930 type:complete len:146 (-) Transcript_1938:378-815(-)